MCDSKKKLALAQHGGSKKKKNSHFIRCAEATDFLVEFVANETTLSASVKRCLERKTTPVVGFVGEILLLKVNVVAEALLRFNFYTLMRNSDSFF